MIIQLKECKIHHNRHKMNINKKLSKNNNIGAVIAIIYATCKINIPNRVQ